ncbi:hypothetical protein HNR23_000215 [Nocardiopsis mwathae]|uniref:Uncharacterized protein n=1 Tax=Nocardiopsis mwathae TaxID=1472723 RepID=A0A7W9YDG1_9ACTN|nr:hypothetical protein [Nocardiopsis mwathae]MBB6170155.1 hypothetical protein [Nocardiopsis mwathae]
MRIYLPSTLPALATVLADGEVRGAPITAFAVTAELSAGAGGRDGEELEYEALRAAADASLALLAEDPQAPRRRVVLAADLPDKLISPCPDTLHPAAVTVAGAVPLKRIASAHIDDTDATDDITRAVAAPDAGHDDEHELLWYATQELKYLVE